MMTSHERTLPVSSAIALALTLAACGPSTPEGKVAERAGLEFHCPPDQIQAKPLDAPTLRRYEASGCGREAVYVNAAPEGAGDNWVLDSPNNTP
jgi:hypothetical protein